MEPAHLHLISTHVPVLGTLFGLCLLGFGAVRGSEDLKKAGLVTFVVAALVTILAYLSGEPAQDALKGIAGVTKEAAEQHQEMAQMAFVAMMVLGVVALTGTVLYRNGKPVSRWYLGLSLGVALLTSGLMGWTANLGGKVRHSEIRGATFPNPR